LGSAVSKSGIGKGFPKAAAKMTMWIPDVPKDNRLVCQRTPIGETLAI
jgi:hypothetical protein